jgi:hypothetical protein
MTNLVFCCNKARKQTPIPAMDEYIKDADMEAVVAEGLE